MIAILRVAKLASCLPVRSPEGAKEGATRLWSRMATWYQSSAYEELLEDIPLMLLLELGTPHPIGQAVGCFTQVPPVATHR